MDNINISKILELYADDSDNNNCVVSINFLDGLSDKLIEVVENFINS